MQVMQRFWGDCELWAKIARKEALNLTQSVRFRVILVTERGWLEGVIVVFEGVLVTDSPE